MDNCTWVHCPFNFTECLPTNLFTSPALYSNITDFCFITNDTCLESSHHSSSGGRSVSVGKIVGGIAGGLAGLLCLLLAAALALMAYRRNQHNQTVGASGETGQEMTSVDENALYSSSDQAVVTDNQAFETA